MKIFQSIEDNLAILGISSYQSIQVQPFNTRNVTTLLVFGLSVISNCVFLFHVADSFMEYTKCVYVVSTLITSFICFAHLVLKMPKLFEFIKNFEQIVEESK